MSGGVGQRLKERRGSDIIRSRRPGAPSLSKAEQDRAEWYKNLSDEVFAKVRADRVEAEDSGGVSKAPMIEDEKKEAEGEGKEEEEEALPTETEEERVERERIEKEEAEAEQARKIQELLEKNRKEAKKFKGGAGFALAEESDAKRKEDEERRNAVGKVRKPDPEFFVRPKDFDPNSWVVRIGEDIGKSAQARVLALPWLCGDANVFKDLAIVLNAENVELYSVQLPGRYVRLREPCFKSIFQVVHHVHEAMSDMFMLDLDLPPLVIFGHSVGAIVGFELTLLIEKEHYENASSGAADGGSYFGVKHLLVTSCNPPHVVTTLNSDRFETKYFCSSGGELWDRFKALDLAPVFLRDRKDLLSMYMPIFRADYTMLEKYIYWQEPPEEVKRDKNARASRLGAASGQAKTDFVQPMLRCPVTAMMAQDDPSTANPRGHEWARHSTIREVQESAMDKKEKADKPPKRDADDDATSITSATSALSGSTLKTGNQTTATRSTHKGSATGGGDNEGEDDNSSIDSRDSDTRARDEERERRRIEEEGRDTTHWWVNVKSGGHMFIRDAINKTFDETFIEKLLNIAYEM